MDTITTGQVAELLGTSEPRLQALLRFGKISPKPKKVGRYRRWTKKDIETARTALVRNPNGNEA